MGKLGINSDPQGTDTYIDGKPTGRKTPSWFLNVKPGKHTIEVEKGNPSLKREKM